MSQPPIPTPAAPGPQLAEPVEAEPITLSYSAPSLEDRPKRWPPAIVLRLVYPAVGIGGPVAGLLFNYEPNDFGVPVDWQNGEPLAWLTLATLPEVFPPLVPFLLASWAAMAAICIAPRRLLGSRLVELGLLTGVVMGVEYAVVVAAGLANGDPGQALLNLVVLQLAVGGVGGLVAFLLLDALVLAGRTSRGVRMTFIVLAIVLGLFFAVSIVAGAPAMSLVVWPIFALPVAAPLSALAHGLMLRRMHLGRLEKGLGLLLPEEAAARAKMWLVVWLVLAVNLVAWIIVRILAGRAYSQLPAVEPTRCFIATAAARSRSSAARGHRQLLRLRSLEAGLCERHPAAHRLIRRLYNQTGPWLAAQVHTPHRAEAAYWLQRPLEVLAARVAPNAHRRKSRI